MSRAYFKVLIPCLYITDNGISFDGHFLKHSRWIPNLKHTLLDLHGPFPVWNLLAESSPLLNKEPHPVQRHCHYSVQSCPAGQCYPRTCVVLGLSGLFSQEGGDFPFLVEKPSLFGIWNSLPAQPIFVVLLLQQHQPDVATPLACRQTDAAYLPPAYVSRKICINLFWAHHSKGALEHNPAVWQFCMD